MTNRHTVAALIVLVVGLVAPRAARAQVVPSPPWGEPIPDASLRFVVLASYNDQAVYDQETGLVWEQSPSTFVQDWPNAQFVCNNRTKGNRQGWRLPTVQELGSLIDPTQTNPALPAGHPFDRSAVRSSFYWSATTSGITASAAWEVYFGGGFTGTNGKSAFEYVWCVRGGQGVNPQ